MMNEFEEEEEFLCEMDGEVENGFDGIVYRVESPHQSFFQNVTSGRTQIFTNPNRAHETDLIELLQFYHSQNNYITLKIIFEPRRITLKNKDYILKF